MPEIKILHLADLHLDSPFKGLSRRDEKLALKFRRAALTALSRAVDAALDHEVDLVTVGGDCFDGRDRSLHAQWYLRNELKRLAEAGIPVLLVEGNHDPATEWSREIGLPETVHVFPPDEVTSYTLMKDGKPAAEVFGVSYGVSEVTENLAKKFPGKSGRLPRIGLLHANVGSNPAHAPYSPAGLQDLVGRGMDLWLLGHIHQPTVLREADPLVLYSGCIQGRDPGESGRRGCYLVALEERQVEARFVPTDVIRWETATVEAGGAVGLEELTDRLIDAGEELLRDLDSSEEGVVVRWRLTGRSPLHRALSAPDKLKELEDLFSEAFRERSPFLYIESVASELQPVLDLNKLAGRQDVIGDLIGLAAAAETDREWSAELAAALDPLWEDDRRGARSIAEIGEAEFKEILNSALWLGLDRLRPEDPE